MVKRIIPCLDLHNGRIVKGVNFVNLVDAGDPVSCSEAYSKAGADELVLLDIAATSDNRNTVTDMISKISKKIQIPLTVGGGVRTVEDIERIIKSGASKVGINSAAVKNPSIIYDAANNFGSQCVVCAIDAKKREDGTGWDVYTSGGRNNTGLDVIEWAVKVKQLGAGEILLTSMDMDGTKAGYDLDLTRQVAEAVDIPVIASGGAGSMEHFYDAITIGKADAVLVASLFHFGEVDIMGLKGYLKSKGIKVRI